MLFAAYVVALFLQVTSPTKPDAPQELAARVPDKGDLDCTKKKYSFVSPGSTTVLFMVTCDTVEPYLEGYRVRLSVGNPFRAAFSDVTGEVHYGDSPMAAIDQKVVLPVVPRLSPGLWTRLEVVIPRASAKDVRYLYLSGVSVKTARD
jgi:hypothetical protein